MRPGIVAGAGSNFSYGIDRGRLVPIGKGLEEPIAITADEAGRALNRRVELVWK